jgi:peptidoglycan/xylan/chitin deacetylase (PgdA/CDA1 family)
MTTGRVQVFIAWNYAGRRAGQLFNLGRKVSFRLAKHLRCSTLSARARRPIVSFTFDDAPVSAALRGAPILEAQGVRGTFYLSGGLLGRIGDIEPILDRSQAAGLAAIGHEIGCHTYAHSDVRNRDWDELCDGLDENARVLAELSGGAAPRNFAYPFGGVSFAKKLRLQSRFATCRGIYPGINAGRIDTGLLKAVPLYSNELDVGRADRWIAAAVEKAGWLIFFTHDVSDNPTPFGVTEPLLRHCVEAAAAAGCLCLPVGLAVDHLRAPARAVSQASSAGHVAVNQSKSRPTSDV